MSFQDISSREGLYFTEFLFILIVFSDIPVFLSVIWLIQFYNAPHFYNNRMNRGQSEKLVKVSNYSAERTGWKKVS